MVPRVAHPTGQSILHASLDHAMLSIEKFSRWLRAICGILLSHNSAASRAKAAGYVEQAVRVLQEHTSDTLHQVYLTVCSGTAILIPRQNYPMDERQWLMGTAYNTGIECLQFARLLNHVWLP